MGQYYIGVNIDKKEHLVPLDFKTGQKLMESCYVGNDFVDALSWLVENDWHGDRVCLIGDYAFDSFERELGAEAYDKLKTLEEDPYELRRSKDSRNVSTRFSTYGPYRFEENAAEIDSATREIDAPTLRYVYNATKGVYLDRDEAPVAWGFVDDDGKMQIVRIDPLTLFLAVGNGLGGGDYRQGPGYELVGSWALDVVGATDTEPEGMEKIPCPFDEYGVFLTATDEEIAAAVEGKELPSDYPGPAELKKLMEEAAAA